MNQYVLVEGGYQEVYMKLLRASLYEAPIAEHKISDRFAEVPHAEKMSVIIKDLKRSRLILDEAQPHHSFKEFIDITLDSRDSYEQGDFFGGLGILLFQAYSAQDLAHFKQASHLSFSYFNHEDVLCGLTLIWEKSNPSCWSVTLYENVGAPLAERKTYYVANKKLFSTIDVPELDSATAQASLFTQLKSEKIQNIIRPIFKIINPSLSLYEKLQERSFAVSSGAAVIPVALGIGALTVTSLPILAVGATAAAAASIIGAGTYWALSASKPEEDSLEALTHSFKKYAIINQSGIEDYIERKERERLIVSGAALVGSATSASASEDAGIEARVNTPAIIPAAGSVSGVKTGSDDVTERETPSFRL